MVIWITGLSGAGKTTLCDALVRLLKPRLPELVVVDGDAVRALFGHDLDFTEQSRMRQIQRIQALASELSRQGLVVLVAALYANPDLLAWNRANFDGYFEVYLNAPLDLVRSRDPKALYAKAARGEVKDMVGLDIPWHAPRAADLVLDAAVPVDTLARRVATAVPRLARALPEAA